MLVHEGAEGRSPRGAPGDQRVRHRRQHLAAQAGHLLVVHEGRLVRRDEPTPEFVRRQQPARLGRRFELGQRGDVDIELVVGQPADREVGARVGRWIEERRVERQGSQHGAADLTRPLPQGRHVRVAADSPVLVRPQRVEGEEDTPPPWGGGARRSHHVEGVDAAPRPLHDQAVVAGLATARHRGAPAVPGTGCNVPPRPRIRPSCR